MEDKNEVDKVELVQIPDNIESDSEPMEEEVSADGVEEEEDGENTGISNKSASGENGEQEEEVEEDEVVEEDQEEEEDDEIEFIDETSSKKKVEEIIDLDSESESNNNKEPEDNNNDDNDIDNIQHQQQTNNLSNNHNISNNNNKIKNISVTSSSSSIAAVATESTLLEEEDILVPESDPFGDCDKDNVMKIDKMDDETENGDNLSTETSDDGPTNLCINDSKSLLLDKKKLSTTSSSSTSSSTFVTKQEPNLVIIDTNAILSGKGLVPIDKSTVATSSSASILSSSSQLNSKGNFDFNARAGGVGTFGDITIGAPRYSTVSSSNLRIPDDAFLIEAPSFIVPYVFEQSGEKSLKDTIKYLEDTIQKTRLLKLQNGEKLDEDDKIIQHVKSTSEDYFESPVGKLLMNVGMNLVQEYVQVDLLKMQRRKAEKEKEKSRTKTMTMETQQSIISLKKNLEFSKENNERFRHATKKCNLCNFKTESSLVMAAHLETPHMKNYSYRCNFCEYTTRIPNEILFHMEAEHFVMPRLERAPAIHQCPNCAFEDNAKPKLTRHLVGCTKRFKLEKNLEPPLDWDTPAKLPKLTKSRIIPQGPMNSYMQHINSQQQQRNQATPYMNIAPKFIPGSGIKAGNITMPPLLQAPKSKPVPGLIRTNPKITPQMSPHLARGMMMRGGNINAGQLGLSQSHLQLTSNQILQQVVGGPMSVTGATSAAVGGFLSKLGLLPSSVGGPNASAAQKSALASHSMRNPKPSTQPSISITPLPRQTTGSSPAASSNQPKQPQGGAGKTSFVICEICDGYIKDLDQLRNHMQWIHKVKIHPKMIYNKPPLNCQKCQFRFFTDQGLERHLLGSHGLVTSSMQDAANKGQDSGRCPLCGKVYQWKLLAHVAKDHNVTLKPAHLSYKCTVCTATFGMYKLFESHVYSAHSMGSKKNDRRQTLPNNNNTNNSSINSNNPSSNNSSANRASQMQVTSRPMSSATSQNSFKPMKINDEITIIPQLLANSHPSQRNKGSLTITPQGSNTSSRRNLMSNEDDGIQIIEIDDAPSKPSANGRNNLRENGDFKGRLPISDSTLRKRNLEISVCGTDSDNNSSDESFTNRGPPQKRLRSSNITIN